MTDAPTQQVLQAVFAETVPRITRERDEALADNARLREQLAKAEAERGDFLEQLLCHEPSAVELDMQLVMACNNNLLAQLRAAEAARDAAAANMRERAARLVASELDGGHWPLVQAIADLPLIPTTGEGEPR